MQILDGKLISQQILEKIKSEIELLPQKPVLDLIVVGSNPASLRYCQMKQETAQSVGIVGNVHQLSETITTEELVKFIDDLNSNPLVTAFMVQLPLPSQIDKNLILNSIDPKKDADGLNACNLGKLFQGDPSAVAPATAQGIVTLLKAYNIDLVGKHVVIINNSPIVGLPLAAIFNSEKATAIICHENTQNLSDTASTADILITAIGKSKFITPEFVKDGSIVVDVGFNVSDDNKVSGDIDFDLVSPKCYYITPVPGGVGPMTIASLLDNTIKIYKCQQIQKEKTK
jgi:methylenetetrahydrofolate dehydrogenase (NADP+) / methenyltetrahydrofolate cyclohydrolase